jgi:membrane protease YdiL (CAAX protease family)
VTLRPWEAFLCVGSALLGLITVGPVLVAQLGLLGIVLSEFVLVGLPTVGFLQAKGLPPFAAMGLGRVSPLAIVGGVLAGAGAFWLVAVLEATLFERLLPVPAPVKESLRRLVVPGSGPRLIVLDILALAIAPAVCEEALFRGLALPSLRARWGTAAAIFVTAVLFAGFHLSLYRLAPAALLGVLLGIVAVRSRSLWPAIAFHTVNNTLVILLVRAGRDAPPSPWSVVGLAGLVAAVIALTVGLLIVRTSKQPA